MADNKDTNTNKKKPGHQRPVKKVKLVPKGKEKEYMTKDAILSYNRSNLNTLRVWGVDEHMATFIEGVFENPNVHNIFASDPDVTGMKMIHSVLLLKPFSGQRWHPTPPLGFFSSIRAYPLIIVADKYLNKELLEMVDRNRKNPCRVMSLQQVADAKGKISLR